MPDRDLIAEGRKARASASGTQLDIIAGLPTGQLQRGLGVGYGTAEYVRWMVSNLPALLGALERTRSSLAAMDVIHDDVISELVDVRAVLEEIAAALGVPGEGHGVVLARARAVLADREQCPINDPRNRNREAESNG
ncbi:hypothetical protein [Nocardia otitidiscaviarum]|uniref:hypothetical protein n=1 Tax=Nocardia otitidiscaviarum TaxID=1823 RepID=UPI0004A7152E|nr:hypothetical protein [Nocardia otitidiscaviarum]